MALLSVIRRWHRRDGMSIRGIARRTGLSRGTVRKYLRNDVVVPRYPKRRATTKLDPFATQLVDWLKAEERKTRKQRRRINQLHAELVRLGYYGSYGRAANFVRGWRRPQTQVAHKRACLPPSAGRNRTRRRRQASTLMCHLCLRPARHSSLTGARTGHSLGASASSSRSRSSSFPTAVPFCFGPTCCKPTKCCSMPTRTPSGC